MSLNEKQKQAYDMIKEGKNVYVSGPGGVGKSFLINAIRSSMKGVVFVAPTGIAALNIMGATIHSTFKFPLSVITKRMAKSKPHSKTEELFDISSNVKIIVIEEISMVRSDVFYAIDQQLRKIRKTNQPFGGLQVVCFGDFYQIPPVLTDNDKSIFNGQYDSQFCFSTETWAEAGFNWIELTEVVRQTNKEMIENLQRIRTKSDDFKDAIHYFNTECSDLDELLDEEPVILCCTNKKTEEYNKIHYDEIDEKEVISKAIITGEFKDRPSPDVIKMKKMTKVIFTVNDPDGKYVNGSIGYIMDFIGEDKVNVLLDPENKVITVDKYKWNQIEYKRDGSGNVYPNIIGSFTQFPFKWGWSITIHKSQGQTLHRGVIDFGWGCFTSGQAYVALSRIRSMDGLGFISPLRPSDVIVDEEITEFYDNGCRGIGLF